MGQRPAASARCQLLGQSVAWTIKTDPAGCSITYHGDKDSPTKIMRCNDSVCFILFCNWLASCHCLLPRQGGMFSNRERLYRQTRIEGNTCSNTNVSTHVYSHSKWCVLPNILEEVTSIITAIPMDVKVAGTISKKVLWFSFQVLIAHVLFFFCKWKFIVIMIEYVFKPVCVHFLATWGHQKQALISALIQYYHTCWRLKWPKQAYLHTKQIWCNIVIHVESCVWPFDIYKSSIRFPSLLCCARGNVSL